MTPPQQQLAIPLQRLNIISIHKHHQLEPAGAPGISIAVAAVMVEELEEDKELPWPQESICSCS